MTPGVGNVVIKLETVYSPSLKVPRYRKEGTKTPATVADFHDQCIVVPIAMLKKHIPSNEIRFTPTIESHNEQTGRSLPATVCEGVDGVHKRKQPKDKEGKIGTGNGITINTTANCPTMEEVDISMRNLTSEDIKLL